MVVLASKCKQLKSLSLNSAYGITDKAVEAVASGCLRLESLDLGLTGITDKAVVALASGHKELTWLGLEGCENITDAAVVALVSGCKKLTSLNLGCCKKITDAARANIPNRIRVFGYKGGSRSV